MRKNMLISFFIVAGVLTAVTMGLLYLVQDDPVPDGLAMEQGIRESVVIPADQVTVTIPESDENLVRMIDFDALYQINPDVRTWVTIPGTNIDYYVMQERIVGEYFYLWNDIYGKKSSWGSCLTPAIPGDEPDAHFLIFGHRMKRAGVAFSNLHYFLEPAFFTENRYVYLYYPDRSERWHIWAACEALPDDIVYDIPYKLNSEQYGAMLGHLAADQAVLTDGQAPDASQETLILSTCHDNDTRMFLVCTLDKAYYY